MKILIFFVFWPLWGSGVILRLLLLFDVLLQMSCFAKNGGGAGRVNPELALHFKDVWGRRKQKEMSNSL